MTDARFADGAERPLALRALDADDLAVLSAVVQDAVLPATEMRWDRKRRRFAMLINRVRREGLSAGADHPERVRAVLAVEDVLAVRSTGIDRGDADLVLSVLALAFTPGMDGGGEVEFILAGDGAISVTVECLEVTLRDVTRPYTAPSRRMPAHNLD
jgi:hypothetical protein